MAAMAFMGGSAGWGEITLLFVVVLVLFGPRRLPEVARMIGRALDQVRRASQDFRNEIMRLDEPPLDSHRDRPAPAHYGAVLPPPGDDTAKDAADGRGPANP